LLELVKNGVAPVRVVNRAHALLLSAAGKTDEEIGEALQVHPQTVRNWHQRFVEEGGPAALEDHPRPGKALKLRGKSEATLVALACSDPPEGSRMLDDAAVSGQASGAEGRRVDLGGGGETHSEKNVLKPWQKKQWCISPVTADFVWRVEDVLDLYAQAYDPQRPVICCDERPCLLRGEVREPCPCRSSRASPKRIDSEYERNGSCQLFLTLQPLSGWQQIAVSERRTSQDFAHWMKRLVNKQFPAA
jgi:hypothetical protein